MGLWPNQMEQPQTHVDVRTFLGLFKRFVLPDWFCGLIGCLPLFPASEESTRSRPANLLKFSRHTGACFFVWSSAVSDQPGIRGKAKLSGPLLYIVGRHTQCSLGLRCGCLI